MTLYFSTEGGCPVSVQPTVGWTKTVSYSICPN